MVFEGPTTEECLAMVLEMFGPGVMIEQWGNVVKVRPTPARVEEKVEVWLED